ncbi:recombinase family protein [Streptomyces sp. NPDC060275]|uniref:recombinase family protein n=1 Tax=Streptomyces sp. NPDC060275 TaxID=3347090 RepID=UPI003665E2BD
MRESDTLVVPSLDRLGRSIQDLIAIVSGLRKRGVGFTSLHEALDTTTPGGPGRGPGRRARTGPIEVASQRPGRQRGGGRLHGRRLRPPHHLSLGLAPQLRFRPW